MGFDMPVVDPFNIDKSALQSAKENKIVFHRIDQLYNDCKKQKFYKTIKMCNQPGEMDHSDYSFYNSTMYLYESDILKNENDKRFRYRMVTKYSDYVSSDGFDYESHILDLGLFYEDPNKYTTVDCRGEKCRYQYSPFNYDNDDSDEESYWCTGCFQSPFNLTSLEPFLKYTITLDQFKEESILFFKSTFNVKQ